jgi:hypothetical protein
VPGGAVKDQPTYLPFERLVFAARVLKKRRFPIRLPHSLLLAPAS